LVATKQNKIASHYFQYNEHYC